MSLFSQVGAATLRLRFGVVPSKFHQHNLHTSSGSTQSKKSFYEGGREKEFSVIGNKYFLFNVFENVPLSSDEFTAFWDDKAQYVRKVEKEHFISTHLHHSENSCFPWVNFAIFNSDDVIVFGKEDPQWRKSVGETFKKSLSAFPAGYRNVANSSGNPNEDTTQSDNQVPAGKGFMLALIEAPDKSQHEELIDNWMETSYTSQLRHQLKERLPAGVDIGDSNLYRRWTMAPRFPLVVRTPAPFENPKDGFELADEMNKTVAAQNGLKITFGFYVVAISYAA